MNVDLKMHVVIILALVLGARSAPEARAGIFSPLPGQTGSDAISADDACFVGWATGATIERGYLNISNPSLGYVSYGASDAATGKADSTGVVSLGDGGKAVLTFAQPITNGDGADFAVFENGFLSGSNIFAELAFVEVSSNGVDFFQFPSTSLTYTNSQLGSFGALDATDVNNLAGKYPAGYGTPFDLEELAGVSPLLDVNAVSYVRLIDVVGCIQDAYAAYDSLGNKINDPWPTAFASGGIDLDAVGVIHQVPEPAAIALLIASGLAVIMYRKGKQK